jgi:hypothetical protein
LDDHITGNKKHTVPETMEASSGLTQLKRLMTPDINEVTIFNGRRSMHRARASYGARTRILAIFSYDTQASVNQTRPDLETRRIFFRWTWPFRGIDMGTLS